MTALPKHKMTVEEYLTWAERQEGRFELFAGVVYAMTPERAEHAEIKYAVQSALLAALQRAAAPCHMLPGVTVRVDDHTAHEPDALVYCGPKIAGDSIEVPNPMIVVEVLSPMTRHIDASAKLAGYFRIASVHHYLIVDPDQRIVIHHRRDNGDTIATKVIGDGSLRLDPPGIELAIADVFRA